MKQLFPVEVSRLPTSDGMLGEHGLRENVQVSEAWHQNDLQVLMTLHPDALHGNKLFTLSCTHPTFNSS
jgi:hypothetical protein